MKRAMPRPSKHILGEVIKVDRGFVSCWLTLRPGLRVKVILKEDHFDGLVPLEGSEFTYVDGRAIPIEFDTREIDAQIAALETTASLASLSDQLATKACRRWFLRQKMCIER